MDKTSLVLSIVLIVGVVFGLYISPNTESLVLIIAIASFVLYGFGRYWRNPSGFSN